MSKYQSKIQVTGNLSINHFLLVDKSELDVETVLPDLLLVSHLGTSLSISDSLSFAGEFWFLSDDENVESTVSNGLLRSHVLDAVKFDKLESSEIVTYWVTDDPET
jgi:hypothetical protein